MKYWFGFPVKECECGFGTPDEDEFEQHLAKTGHKPAEEKQKAAKAEAKKESGKSDGKKPADQEEEKHA